MNHHKARSEPIRLDWIAILLAGFVLVFSAAALIAFVPVGPCPRCGVAHAQTARWAVVVQSNGYPKSVRENYAALLDGWQCDYCRGRGKCTLLDQWKAWRKYGGR